MGEGWLIFGLPPAEVAVHPSEKNDIHEFYLMCDDLDAFVAEVEKHGIRCDPVQDSLSEQERLRSEWAFPHTELLLPHRTQRLQFCGTKFTQRQESEQNR